MDYLLQLAHGADPTMKNQEGQTPLDLTSVSIVKKQDSLIDSMLAYEKLSPTSG